MRYVTNGLRPLVCALVLLLPLGAVANPSPALPHVAQRIELRQELHIIAFGSSSTEGAGATSKDRCYPSRLQADLAAALPKGASVAVFNRGIGGEDVDDMMARLPTIIAEKPDLVIWQTGSNDALRSVQLEHFIAETTSGIVQMERAGIDVILMEPQFSQRLTETATAGAFVEAVRNIGRQMHVQVIRRYELMRQWLAGGTLTYQQMMSGDGLHMTDGGYDLLAKSVADTILATTSIGPVAAK